jgi:4-hydroxy-4-methyl-2-oxoglutarate aldolase
MSTRSNDSLAGVLERLAGVDTTSLVDAGRGLRVLPTAIRPVRRGMRLIGRALTVDARGDLMSVLAGLQQSKPRDVLVVAAGSDEHAVAGELFATEALRRGMAGIVIDGLCRDSATLVELNLPIYARGVTPTACPARAVPVVQVPIMIGSVEVRPGDLVLGDDDGLVVATEEEVMAVIDAAEAIQRREEALRAEIAAGSSLFGATNYEEHVAAVRAGRDSRLTFF